MFMGRGISYQQANEIVAPANRVYNVLNEGRHGANIIGYGEAAFAGLLQRPGFHC